MTIAATLALCDAVEGACLPDTYPTRIAARLRVMAEVWPALEAWHKTFDGLAEINGDPTEGYECGGCGSELEGPCSVCHECLDSQEADLAAAYRAAVAKLEAMP